MKSKLFKAVCIFLLFASAAFSITYWAIAKYDVRTDFSSNDAAVCMKMSKMQYDDVPKYYSYRILMPTIVYGVSNITEKLNVKEFLGRYYENVEQKMIQLNFGIVNIFFISLTAFLLFYYCRRLGFSDWESLVGGFMFLTSFFVVTYFTIPMIDSMSSFLILAGFYAVLRKSMLGIFLAFLLGIFTKETSFIILLLIIFQERKIFSKTILVCIPAIIIYLVFIIKFPPPCGAINNYIFANIFNIGFLREQLMTFFRGIGPYEIIEYIQIFMFTWVLMIYALLRCKKPIFIQRSLWLLLLIFILPPLVGAKAVGRAAFYFYPIAIPLGLLALRDIFNKDKTIL